MTEAISKAGGALPDSRSNGVKVYRSVPDSNKKEMITIKELRAVERGRIKDVELRAGDLVIVVPRDRRKAVPQASIMPCPSKSPGALL
jgi:protein involved in polysaccharide export with SLBB domain